MLLTVVFLWLGNYSFADCVSCKKAALIANWLLTSEQVNTQCATECGTTTTPTTTNIQQKYPPCEGTRASDVGAYQNALTCVCKPWYKPGTNPCQKCSDPGVCCGVELNTSVPFIGKCIEAEATADYRSSDELNVTSETAFPVLMWSMTKILVTLILIVSFVLIIIWGIMISTGDPAWGKKMIIKVVIGIALLWASGVILRLINPNFFG